MGIRLCVKLGDKPSKFGNVDFVVDDMDNENPGVRVKPPAKTVKNDMADDGNDDMDTRDKSDRIRNAPKSGEQCRVNTGEHLRQKGAPELRKYRSLDIRSTEKSYKSLATKMAERRNNPKQRDEFAVEGVNAEHEAKSYMTAVQNNTIDQLKETFTTVESIIVKETDTMEELKRQGNVVEQANQDIHDTEKDINDTNWRLKGMESLSNKLANIMFRKKPLHFTSAQIYVPQKNKLGIGYRRSVTVPIELPSQTSMDKSEWISTGVDQLCHLLEEVEHKEIELAHELENQEEAMHQLDENMDHIEKKITNQTKVMSSMTKK